MESSRRIEAQRRQAQRCLELQRIITKIEVTFGKCEGHEQTLRELAIATGNDHWYLLAGPTGVGKNFLAERIHKLSARANGPFIAINIATLPEGMVASALFGHEQGAFTGAHKVTQGCLESANNGTLFIDEIDKIAPINQNKILTAFGTASENTVNFSRIGSSRLISSDIRIISASNQNLLALGSQGAFLPDLYYRLCANSISIPPLKDRKNDIPVLAERFAAKSIKNIDSEAAVILSPQAASALQAYPWPGNVRQLVQVMQQAVQRLMYDPKVNIDGEGKYIIEEKYINLEKNNETVSGVDGNTTISLMDEDKKIIPYPQLERTLQNRVMELVSELSGPVAASVLGVGLSTIKRWRERMQAELKK